MKSVYWFRLIAWITSLFLVVLEFYSLWTGSHYKYDFLFLMALLWGVYLLKDRFKVHPFHFFLLCVFLILHNLGTFGTYSMDFFGIEYDFYVHTFFGIVSGLMLYRTYTLVGPYKKKWFVCVTVIALVLGFSAFHELFEYAGAILVGEGEGVLFVGAGDVDEWDTQKDMRNNLLGGLMALLIYFLYGVYLEKFKIKKRS